MIQETSREAWERIQSVAPNLREAVYQIIKRVPMTTDEIEALTDLRHQTASARVNDLMKMRMVFDSGDRRKTRSGRNAIVWTTERPDDGQMGLFE
jgi:hypothetical protein